LQLTHSLSRNTYYELRLAYNTRDYKSYAFENPFDLGYAPSNKIKGEPGGETFLFGGVQNDRNIESSRTYLGKFDLTSQVNKQNLVKGGLEYRFNVLDREYYSLSYDRNIYQEPTATGGGTYIRYPTQLSAYIQDKLEYDVMIINVGLRYDYFYSDAQFAVNELQPDGAREQAEPKHMLAPRAGISFPITETGIIHLSYGHFYQMPALTNLYTNPYFNMPASGTPLFGNADLDPEKTILYEIGLQQQFGDMFALDITGFYKDIRNLLAWQTIQFRTLSTEELIGGDVRTYRVRRNQDYGNVKGITLSFEKRMRPDSPVAAKIDYTFQVAEGNDNNSSAFYYNSLSGQETIKKIVPLDWDQTHNLYGSFTLMPSEGLTLSMIGRLSTGYPYTPLLLTTNYDSEPNSDSKPLQKTFDLRISYRFEFMNMHPQIFLKVYNLFDDLNERYVFDDTGRASYTYATRSIDEPASFKKHYGEPGVHTYDEYNVRPQYYSTPREIRLGFSLEF
jgi:outer membrane receptor protein involved in Fe transport